MTFNPNFRTKILSTGSAFPSQVVTNFDLAKTIETSDEWIYERTGIQARRIADLNKGESNSELAYQASLLALSRANLTALDLDLILYATITPDSVMPSTACILQERLGAKNAAALDISAACSGFIYGLSIADAMIRMGQYKNILVIGSETLSPIVNWQDRTTCILFGDGSGAAIVSQTTTNDPACILSTHLYADGWCKDYLVAGGGSATPITHSSLEDKSHLVKMKGKEIYKVAVKMLADCALAALEKNGLTIDDVDWMIPHQANLRIIEAVAKRLNFPMHKVILNIQNYGNTSAATIPTALDEAVTSKKIKRGDLILLNAFGAGLTYGSALFRF